MQVLAQVLAAPAGPALPAAVVEPAQELPGPAALVGDAGNDPGVQAAARPLQGLHRAAEHGGPHHGGSGQGRGLKSACEGIARNPDAAGKIQVSLILGLAFVESLAIYSLVVNLIILFANPFI